MVSVAALIGCGHAAAPAERPVVSTEPARVLADGSVELPPSTIEKVAVPRGVVRRAPTPGVAVAHTCRKPGHDEPPSVALLQSSGDATVDRALLGTRVIRPADEPVSDQLRCGYGITVTQPQQPAHPPAPKIIPPDQLDLHRLGGDRALFPSDAVRAQIAHDRRSQLQIPIKVCVDKLGRVFAIEILASSGYLAYDLDLINGVAGWTYSPVVDDEPIEVCSVVQFVYNQIGNEDGGPWKFRVQH